MVYEYRQTLPSWRRAAAAAVLALLALLGFASAAYAHALVRVSDPTDGATLDRAPTSVTITFTERPEPKLSYIHVLNSAGHQIDSGSTQTVPSDPLKLTVSLGKIPDGVYTVNWRTVSAVDGHLAAGALSFGVGVTAGEVANAATNASSPATPPPPPLSVVGRWIFYVGLGLLLGGTWISLLAFGAVRRELSILALAGVGAATVGVLTTAEGTREAAGVDWGTLLSTSLGQNLVEQIVPLLVAAALVGVTFWTRGAVRPLQGVIAGVVGVAILVHVVGSHALSSSQPWLEVAAQFGHLSAFAIWIGGLAALLVGVRGLPSAEKTTAVRRFSLVAGYSLALIALTGVVRAIDEVGTWSRLLSTLFGNLVVVKASLLVVLAGLGAVNRYRNVPAIADRLGGLRRIGGTELAVASVVIGVAAILTSLPPPSFVTSTAAPAPPEVAVDSHDYGTTVRGHLVLSPGLVGPNAFALSLTDYDTGKPVRALNVQLRFTLPARSDVGASTLTLTRTAQGVYRAQGLNFSLPGQWSVVTTVQTATDSVEIPFTVNLKAPPPRVRTIVQPGQPTIYVIDQPDGGQTQAYIDPGTAGINQIHLTYLDASGQEENLPHTPTVVATSASGAKPPLTLVRFSQGHFSAQGPLTKGQWTFNVAESAPDGGTQFTAQWAQAIGAG